MDPQNNLLKKLDKLLLLMTLLLLLIGGAIVLTISFATGFFSFEQALTKIPTKETEEAAAQAIEKNLVEENIWTAPDTTDIPNTPEGDLIRYGRELIAHTSVYLGPKGKVRQISNGLNCQNCHLQGGTLPYGNNFSVTAWSYPKTRKRSGLNEDFVYRVNGCFERSMNGQKLDPESREMKAFIAYFMWMGQGVKKGERPFGTGLQKVSLLDRAADPEKGKALYAQHCTVCHGPDGQGVMAPTGLEYVYPPIFGENSFNTGAGMYRLEKFASFIKTNMPLGVTYKNPALTDEECWDIAAFVNSQPRPEKDLSADWPNIADKPYDHPFGPFADDFTEEEHKYGPYQKMLKK